MTRDTDPHNAFKHRHEGWGAPHRGPEDTPPDRDRLPERDPDLGYAAGELEGDFQHRARLPQEEPESGFSAWLRRRRWAEFESWRANNPLEQAGVAPPEAVMVHNPVDAPEQE